MKKIRKSDLSLKKEESVPLNASADQGEYGKGAQTAQGVCNSEVEPCLNTNDEECQTILATCVNCHTYLYTNCNCEETEQNTCVNCEATDDCNTGGGCNTESKAVLCCDDTQECVIDSAGTNCYEPVSKTCSRLIGCAESVDESCTCPQPAITLKCN